MHSAYRDNPRLELRARCVARTGAGGGAFRASGRYLSVEGRCIFLFDHGAGPPLLFLHGIPTFSYVWRNVLPPLAPRWRCLAPDLLGFGYSEKPGGARFGVARQAEIVTGLLDELGIDRAAVVAHDFGALVAAELLARQPARVASLVLTNTSLRRQQWRSGPPLSLLRLPLLGELAMTLARRWMLKLAMRIYVSDDARLTPEVMAHYWWPFQHGFKRTLLALSRQRWAGEDDFARWRTALAGMAAPALIVWGGRDPTFTLDEADDLAALLPHARLEVLPGANHFLQEDAPAALAALVAAHLAT
ncbi:MAG TPA: alpha/beta hydrolase [Thermomicrobiaceae bacterium]|nr:alpha/beta hydrolase [Thermomicrobiaceae bacterium]